MLELKVVMQEGFDEETNRFVESSVELFQLEHSLVSVSKWESEFEKPFLSSDEKTSEETIAYIRMMILTSNVSDELLTRLITEFGDVINKYINAKRTATFFGDAGRSLPSRQIITSELIYYWMITLSVPFECQTWHLNRLLTLIQVCNQKNKPAKKMSRSEIARRNRELNAQRRRELGTSG